MHSQPLTGTIADLQVGDEVLTLPDTGMTLGRGNGLQYPPLLICEATPSQDDTLQLTTSNGPMTLPAHLPVTYLRDNTLRPDTPLLLSRRVSLHAALLSYGIPMIRRSPAPNDQSAPEVSAREWVNAPMILIDGYLSVATLRAFTDRDDIQPRDNLLMIGDDPDDARIYTRAALIGGLAVVVLPYDVTQVLTLLHMTSPNVPLPDAVAQMLANRT